MVGGPEVGDVVGSSCVVGDDVVGGVGSWFSAECAGWGAFEDDGPVASVGLV